MKISNLALFLVSSIVKGASAGPPTKKWVGPSKEFGKGEIAAYTIYEAEDIVEVGVEFTATMLEGMPDEISDGTYDIDECGEIPKWYCCGHEIELEFPKQANGRNVFDHFVMNWNPAGHGPYPGPYTLPHFDPHFYLIDRETRLSVQPSDKCYAVPEGNPFAGTPIPMTVEDYFYQMEELPCDQIPPGHTYLPAVEPAMGAHMVDFSSPEFAGEEFSATYIFGRQGGEIAFFEPMITLEFILSVADNGDFEDSYALPEKAPKAGFYPSKYAIKYDGDTEIFKIALMDFTFLEKSTSGTSDCVQPYPPPPPARRA